jgi:hypothetical protein
MKLIIGLTLLKANQVFDFCDQNGEKRQGQAEPNLPL